MPRQLSFDLPGKTALGREDFFVSPANAAVVGMVEGWQVWPARKMVLVGPPGSGKTHLAHVWAALSGAQIIQANALTKADIPGLAETNIAVEDANTIAGDTAAEEALFHLHNLALAEGRSVLLTAALAPNLWGLSLPDLASRMQATATATLLAPDDTLLAAVLMKLMADRQLSPTPDTIPYLTRRIDRSFDAARRIVAQMDATALATGHEINRALAGRVLDKAAK